MYFVYILTNFSNSTLYIGVTNNLVKRVYEHKQKFVHGFTNQYYVDKLVYFEHVESVNEAISREKQLKNWHRQWKMNLVKSQNPDFQDLFKKIV